jgi:methylated-DNA-protein-cysteine methyltransferase related protein
LFELHRSIKNKDFTNKSFFQRVYDVVRLVPKGRITTYGDIAEYIGQRGAARMVGWAMNASHIVLPPVPAHRVVNRNGLLSGKRHFHPPELMIKLLENEGIKVKNDKVMNFNKLLWVPIKELKD